MSEAKKPTRGGEGGQGALLFVGIRVQHGVSQLNVTRTAVLVTSCHISWDSKGIFCPPPPNSFFEFSCQKQKNGGGEGAQLFVRNMGTARGVPAKCDEDCRLVRYPAYVG